MLRYHWRSKVSRAAQMDASLFDEVVTACSALTTPSLGASYIFQVPQRLGIFQISHSHLVYNSNRLESKSF
jgi:hypothetical protein